MNFLIKYPTRARPKQFFKVLDMYIDMFSIENDYHVLVSCDNDDPSMNNNATIARLKTYAKLSFFFAPRDTKIRAINRDIDKISYDWDIVIGASDDSIPIAAGYDKIVASEILVLQDLTGYQYADTDCILWFDDPFRNDLPTVIIMGRKYYDRFGYILNPVYDSMYAENELIAVGKDHIIRVPKTIIEHRHHSSGRPGSLLQDKLYKENHIPYAKDRNTFTRRRAAGFK